MSEPNPPDSAVATAASLTDAIAAVLGGDVDAYDVVVRRYGTPLRAYMLSRAPDRDAADDLAQTALVTAFEQLDRFALDADFGAWLFGIARNLAREAWRRSATEGRHRDQVARHVRECLLDRTPTATDAGQERLAALRGCVDALPERWATIVGWHYGQRRTLADIADELGNAPSSVGVTLHRIRRQLRACIEARLAALEAPR